MKDSSEQQETLTPRVEAIVSRASWFNIRWIDEPWTMEEMKKAVEIQTALAWWFAQNDPGTPIPDWGYLFDPIDKAEILELWDEWNAERTSG